MSIYTRMPTEPCSKCGRIFARPYNLKYHMDHDVCTNQSKTCTSCGLVLSSGQRLTSHMKVCAKLQRSGTSRVVHSLIELERLKTQKAKHDADKEQAILEQMKIAAQQGESISLPQINIGCCTTTTNSTTNNNLTINVHTVAHGKKIGINFKLIILTS